MKLLHAILFVCGFLPLSAQRYVEMGFFCGFANYQGDLSKSYFQLGETKAALGGILRYHLNPKVDLRGSLFFGAISGDDKNSPELQERKFRFKSNILEAGIMGEWKMFGKPRFNAVGVFIPNFTPYLFGGVAYTYAEATTECYKPECLGNGQSPFPEQGYHPNYISMPVGFGLRYDFSEYVSLGGEWGYRAIFSDYLDGVSATANSKGNDWYFFTGGTISFYPGQSAKDYNLSRRSSRKRR